MQQKNKIYMEKDNLNNENSDQTNVEELAADLETQNDQEPQNEEMEQSEAYKTLQALNDQIESLQDKLLRSLADAENLRLRSDKMTKEARDYSIMNFAKDLLPVMDNLSRALEHAPAQPSAELQNILDGIEMTKKELHNAFAKNDLEAIEPHQGDKFDYNYHQAISQIMTDEFKEGTIVNIMQVGYKIKDRLLRPAAVTVAKK